MTSKAKEICSCGCTLHNGKECACGCGRYPLDEYEASKLLREIYKLLEMKNWSVLSKQSRSHAFTTERNILKFRNLIEKMMFRYCQICCDNVEVDDNGNCLSGSCGGTYPYRELK